MIFDLHVHTKFSKCSNITDKMLLKAAKEKRIDGFVIVDHDTLDGFKWIKKELKNLEIVPGIEIRTKHGELMGLFIEHEIKSKGLSIEEMIDLIHDAGGMVVAPHPFDFFRRESIGNYIKNIKADGIEIFNSRCVLDYFNKLAFNYAKQKNLIQTAGSDAHFYEEIGNCLIKINGNPEKEIKSGKFKIVKALKSNPIVHLKTKIIELRKMRLL